MSDVRATPSPSGAEVVHADETLPVDGIADTTRSARRWTLKDDAPDDFLGPLLIVGFW